MWRLRWMAAGMVGCDGMNGCGVISLLMYKSTAKILQFSYWVLYC